jgi:hypothetical protein
MEFMVGYSGRVELYMEGNRFDKTGGQTPTLKG